MKRLVAAVVMAVAMATPVLAEITWLPSGARFELSGALLFRLREQLPVSVADNLKAIRNRPFADGVAFREALAEAGVGKDVVETLVEAAAVGGASFGYEPRGAGMATIYVEGSEPALDDNPFTAASWLTALPVSTAASEISAAVGVEGCLDVRDGNAALFSLCEPETGSDETAVSLRTDATHIVGLGQEFQVPGDTTAERAGFVRHGSNAMTGFNGGANGNTLFPVAYFGAGQKPFALILDNRYQQEWNLKAQPYRLRVWGGDFRLHVITGDTLADLRRQYMAMAGHPPVPPKAMFGLWLSEYSFDGWAEVEDRLASLETNGFPVSGVVLDLEWFGGIEASSPRSRMGSLAWDTTAFPDPKAKIAELKERGIGVMAIEESYVSAGLAEFAALAEEHALVRDAAGAPALVNPAGNWWGRGGMIDWTSEHARRFWHDFRRQALIDDGLVGHWTDLGEPEMVSPGFIYAGGLQEAQVHNSYNLLWLKGIADGYTRTAPGKRPFMLSRSGAIGMQALGAAMWSADTGGDYGSLAAQMPQQTHMMWSGMDYYGSDVGGFHRSALGNYPGARKAAMDDLYTQWLAYSALFEVPIRPHTENLCNCKETSPDRIGDLTSNRENLLLRRDLTPYYYSLAHAAWLDGEPVFPSVDYWYPEANEAATLGQVKMIGPEFIGAAAAQHGAQEIEVYLPEGTWYDFRTLERIDSAGARFSRSVRDAEGRYALPLFIKDGGLVPIASGGQASIAVVGSATNAFDWYDDDGETTAYQHGDYDHVRLSLAGRTLSVERIRGNRIAPRTVTWTSPPMPISRVLIGGRDAPFRRTAHGIEIALPSFEKSMKIELVQ